jgi:hypothetical protein
MIVMTVVTYYRDASFLLLEIANGGRHARILTGGRFSTLVA